MQRVDITDVENRIDSASVSKRLADELGAEHVALNYYELEPGESFAFGYHMHEQQEEIFAIQTGTATFETEEGKIEVGAGEIVRFAPGEFQQGWNTGDDSVVALAIGAPQETGRSEVRRECTACGDRTRHTIEFDEEGTALLTRCLTCETVTGRYER